MKTNTLTTQKFFDSMDMDKSYCVKFRDLYGKTHFVTGTASYVMGAVLLSDTVLEYMEF